ncbi:Bifunctional purine biosynthesis [Micractinium conductrix]|uniref:Bifunctional purine biosynthesis n=1 Tax=Micractinium conductrix TaxID=554055 RepID=A0A2P6V3M3_9CHLO|nr:Bifunctional purine biosynthesis [Micractinium conductrix]|eukprot:PSC68677.1 Bifunctional purine biosynthesis [Micractinium conductrix]
MQTCAHTARLSVLCLGVHRVAGARLSSAAAIGATAFTGSTSVLRQPAAAGRASLSSTAAAAVPVMAAAAGSKGKALISVSDKTGLDALAKGLSDLGYEIVSTGGSATAIEAAGVPVKRVEELTGFPEMLDGRVKTLHPGVHGGILARRDLPAHMEAISQHNITPIDLVIVNLYPFRQTVTAAAKPSYEVAVENIDIGGPAMIRAAAKNHAHVTVVVNPSDYTQLLGALGGGSSADEALAFRKRCAWKAFQHCATYDSTVAEWMWGAVGEGPAPEMSVPMKLAQGLRYGENPHQSAAFYTDASLAEHGLGGVATAVQHHGKEMSYNNYLDADAAYSAACDFAVPTCVIVKHTNPCGVASRDDLLEAYRLAVIADPISAFGGIVAFNRPVDAELARELREFRSPTDGETRMFYEIVIAPGYTPEGLEVLKGKSKTLRILEATPRAPSGRSLRQVAAGWLQQGADTLTPEQIEFTCVSEKQPTTQQLQDLKFAWLCVKHVKSNAITVAKDGKLLGMGSGQPNRVKSVQIALEKAQEEVKGSVLASDAFFPFSWNDSVEIACQAGVAAIVHPGGSVRDADAVECCNKYGVVLLTTGVRHFKH